MTVILAEKTLQAIESQIESDQGAKFRQTLGEVIPHIGDAYRGYEFPFRTHLGASVIGDACARKIWYSFRWSVSRQFEPRMLRLFNRGHLEEGRFIAMLLAIGCQVYQQDGDGKQYKVAAVDGHFGGSGDGVVVGIPDLPPNTPALSEFKTAGDRPFTKLKKSGLRAEKPQHFFQMQVLMHEMGLEYGIYLAVNKNTDEIYGEIVKLDSSIALESIKRADYIIKTNTPPSKLSHSPGWYECKFCDYREVCHLDAAPEKNCRTCVHSQVGQGGSWFCKKSGEVLDKFDQLAGCGEHERLF